MKEKLELFLKENYIKEKRESRFANFFESKFLGSTAKAFRADECDEEECCDEAPSLDNYLDNNKEPKFRDILFKYIDDKKLKDSDVYKKVNLDRRLFSKIRCDDNYNPSKETVLLLALSLELTEEKLNELLSTTSYHLSNSSISDLIIRFCFINKIYNIDTVNEFLYDHKCKTLN